MIANFSDGPFYIKKALEVSNFMTFPIFFNFQKKIPNELTLRMPPLLGLIIIKKLLLIGDSDGVCLSFLLVSLCDTFNGRQRYKREFKEQI